MSAVTTMAAPASARSATPPIAQPSVAPRARCPVHVLIQAGSSRDSRTAAAGPSSTAQPSSPRPTGHAAERPRSTPRLPGLRRSARCSYATSQPASVVVFLANRRFTCPTVPRSRRIADRSPGSARFARPHDAGWYGVTALRAAWRGGETAAGRAAACARVAARRREYLPSHRPGKRHRTPRRTPSSGAPAPAPAAALPRIRPAEVRDRVRHDRLAPFPLVEASVGGRSSGPGQSVRPSAPNSG